MEKDLESCMPQHQVDGQLHKSLKLPLDLEMQKKGIPCAVPCTGTIPSNCSLPAFEFSGLPNLKTGHLNYPRDWFYFLPRFRHGVIPNLTPNDKFLPKTSIAGKVPMILDQNSGEVNFPITDKGCAPKQFLMFDHTGYKTTMIFSSGAMAPHQLLNTSTPRDNGYGNACGDEIELGSNRNDQNSAPNLTDELGEDHLSADRSEMHEDTDEINALLYSDYEDEDDYSEGDDDETSTGHFPSTMTAHEKRGSFDEDDLDEVASSAEPVKRQKLCDNGYKVLSATNTASVVKLGSFSWYEDDAESSCAVGKHTMKSCNLGLLSGNKGYRKEKIHETVSILQTIIPGGKGKDAVMVLDEAINYLRALRLKAKSLGLSNF